MRYAPLFIILIASVFFVNGCKDSITQSQIDAVVIPDSKVGYAQYIQPVLTAKCAFSGCHDQGSRRAGVSLSSYLDFANNLSLITPGLPQNSKLVWSIEANGVPGMPPVGYPSLNSNQIKGIRTWITEGAKDN